MNIKEREKFHLESLVSLSKIGKCSNHESLKRDPNFSPSLSSFLAPSCLQPQFPQRENETHHLVEHERWKSDGLFFGSVTVFLFQSVPSDGSHYVILASEWLHQSSFINRSYTQNRKQAHYLHTGMFVTPSAF